MSSLGDVVLKAPIEVSRSMAQGLRSDPNALTAVGVGVAKTVLNGINHSPGWATIGCLVVYAVGSKYFSRDTLKGDIQQLNNRTSAISDKMEKIEIVGKKLDELEAQRKEQIEQIEQIAEALIRQNEDFEKIKNGQLYTNEELKVVSKHLSDNLAIYENRIRDLIDLATQQGKIAEGFAGFIVSQNEFGETLNKEIMERINVIQDIYKVLNRLLEETETKLNG